MALPSAADHVSENHTTMTDVVLDDGGVQADTEGLPLQEGAEAVPPPPVPQSPPGRRLRMPSGRESEFIKRFRFDEDDFADEESYEEAVAKSPISL